MNAQWYETFTHNQHSTPAEQAAFRNTCICVRWDRSISIKEINAPVFYQGASLRWVFCSIHFKDLWWLENALQCVQQNVSVEKTDATLNRTFSRSVRFWTTRKHLVNGSAANCDTKLSRHNCFCDLSISLWLAAAIRWSRFGFEMCSRQMLHTSYRPPPGTR